MCTCPVQCQGTHWSLQCRHTVTDTRTVAASCSKAHERSMWDITKPLIHGHAEYLGTLLDSILVMPSIKMDSQVCQASIPWTHAGLVFTTMPCLPQLQVEADAELACYLNHQSVARPYIWSSLDQTKETLNIIQYIESGDRH